MRDFKLQPGRHFYFLVFGLSGFAGLIYESIWTQYIKLFLGHAAYAQTLVLAIFMGGLAVGSWIASRRSAHWKSLLIAYAAVEGLVGVAALVFHPVFVAATDAAYDRLLPGVGSIAVAQGLKWSLAAAFVLPQSILLGMTFPLMSGALIRRFPQAPGESLGMLYFTNSFGAALGVIASGFFLIGRVGLPGTMLTAGLINIFLALLVWLAARGQSESAPAIPAVARGPSAAGWVKGMLAAAFLTGAASFIYEIAWIRALSLLLGSTTHSFELMLSAFVLGLAFGGLWIRRRIERSAQLPRLLGWVQLAMGLCALATLPLFSSAFGLMQYFLTAVARSEQGYQLFNLASHALCLLLMLPTTFCAGATLPLMTCILLRRGMGERSIGAIYASNTLGAIAGVVLAVHVLMPLTGLKGAIWAGAALDLGLGIALLVAIRSRASRLELGGSVAVAALALALTVALVQLDPLQLLSGVYRTGAATLQKDTQVLFLRDGKTATVGLVRKSNGMMVISTNGKPDAGVQVEGDGFVPDESTMVLAGALGLAAHRDVKTVANIGMGSGMTTHVLLSTPRVERVDTIEIEPFMVEAAKGFGPRVERAFTDPRSHIYIEDAKTFFSTRNARYDLIVSEPSNPWVSGVATLFSDEFYSRIVKHLQPDGVLVQWIQLYEADLTLVASIVKAMSPHFSDYAIYNSNDGDILLVAKKEGMLPPLNEAALSEPGLRGELRRIHVNGLQDIEARRIGSKRTLDAMFQSFAVPANSDYFPFVDQNAARMRFRDLNGVELAILTIHPLPLLGMLNGEPRIDHLTQNTWLFRSGASTTAQQLRQALLQQKYAQYPKTVGAAALLPFLFVDACVKAESEEVWVDGLVQLAGHLTPYFSPEELEPVWHRLESEKCSVRLTAKQRGWLTLVKAVGRRDAPAMALAAKGILERGEAKGSHSRLAYAVLAGMLGNLVAGTPDQGRQIWKEYGSQVVPSGLPPLDLRLLLALTGPDGDINSNAAKSEPNPIAANADEASISRRRDASAP